MAEPAPTPNPDPWIQGQIDSLTEDVPGYLSSINRSGVNRSGISDTDLVIKGHLICDAIYAHRGDVSMGKLPNVRPDDYHSMEVVAGASIKYLCPRPRHMQVPVSSRLPRKVRFDRCHDV